MGENFRHNLPPFAARCCRIENVSNISLVNNSQPFFLIQEAGVNICTVGSTTVPGEQPSTVGCVQCLTKTNVPQTDLPPSRARCANMVLFTFILRDYSCSAVSLQARHLLRSPIVALRCSAVRVRLLLCDSINVMRFAL